MAVQMMIVITGLILYFIVRYSVVRDKIICTLFSKVNLLHHTIITINPYIIKKVSIVLILILVV